MSSSTLQIHKKQVQTQLQISEEQSFNLVFNLLKITLGSIAYIRMLFPESDFKTTTVNGMPLKTLDRRTSTNSSTDLQTSTSPPATALLDWLDMGIAQAITRKYLKSLVFAIYSHPDLDDNTHLIECYSFNFTYPDSSSSSSSSDTHLHLLATSTDAATRKRTTAPLAHAANIVSRSDIVRATTSMLRRLIVATQTMTPLPSRTWISMKLFYNDDTPVEYEPPCFKTGNESDAAILNNVVKEDAEGGDDDDNLKVGALNTGFHGVDMRLRATLSTENTPNPAEDAAQLSEDQSGSIPQEQLQQEHLEPLVSDSLDQQKQEEDVDTAATFNDEIEDVDDDEMMDMVPSSMVSSIAADTVAPVAVGRKDGDIEMMEGGGVGDDQVQDEQDEDDINTFVLDNTQSIIAQLRDTSVVATAVLSSSSPSSSCESLDITEDDGDSLCTQIDKTVNSRARGGVGGGDDERRIPVGTPMQRDLTRSSSRNNSNKNGGENGNGEGSVVCGVHRRVSTISPLSVIEQLGGDEDVSAMELQQPQRQRDDDVRMAIDGGEEDDLDEDEELDVDCPCGCAEADLDMIQCSGCDKWAHLVCFGYSSPTDPSIPPIHVCYKCRNSRSSNNKNKYNAATCDEEVGGGVGGDGNTSSTINEFYDLDKASEVALYRRCLSVVWNEGLLNSTWLASRLGIEFQVATQLTRRLQRDCIVRNKSRRKKASTDQYTVVKSENSKRHFAFWMSQVSFQSVGGGETASLTTTTPVAACVIDADATAVVKNNSKANKNSKKVSVASLPATGGGCGGGGARRLRTGKEF